MKRFGQDGSREICRFFRSHQRDDTRSQGPQSVGEPSLTVAEAGCDTGGRRMAAAWNACKSPVFNV